MFRTEKTKPFQIEAQVKTSSKCFFLSTKTNPHACILLTVNIFHNNLSYLYTIQFVRVDTHTLTPLRERTTERYENCCDKVYPLADGHGRTGIFIYGQYKC